MVGLHTFHLFLMLQVCTHVFLTLPIIHSNLLNHPEISNFTEDWNEFDLSLDDYIRITNKSVCHGCWNKVNIDHSFDKNDWYWCPLHKNTERQFECHKSITPEIVLEKIKHWL